MTVEKPRKPSPDPEANEAVGSSLWTPSRRTFIVAGGAAALLAACGDDAETATPTTTAAPATTAAPTTTAAPATTAAPTTTEAELVGTGMTIGLSLNVLVPYTQYLAAGVLKALEGTGYEFTSTNANFDVAKQVSDIESMLAQGVDGLVVLPVDYQAVVGAAATANAQGVPVANCVWPGPSDGDEEFVAVANIDSATGGRLLANWVMENTEPGQIIVVQGIVGQGFSEKIDEGFDAVISSDWEVVVREQGFFDPAAAVQIVETGLQAHPDASIIIDYAAVMAGGICTFLQTNGIENIIHLTSDIDEPLLDWFGTPYLAGTRYFSPADLGRLPTLELRKALEGGTPTFEVEIEQLMATAENIDQVIADIPFNHPEFDEITTKL